MTQMTISRAARAAGVGVETIRFYERKGLIDRPLKPARGYRTYSADAVARVRFIREAQKLGFSLGEVGELLSLSADPDAACADVRHRAEIKLDEVAHKIDRLERVRDALTALVALCPGEGPALRRCSILDALHAKNGGEEDG